MLSCRLLLFIHLACNSLQLLIRDSGAIPSPPLLRLGRCRAVPCVRESEEATAVALQVAGLSVPAPPPHCLLPPAEAPSSSPSGCLNVPLPAVMTHLGSQKCTSGKGTQPPAPPSGDGWAQLPAGTPQATPQLPHQGPARLPSPLHLLRGGPSPSPGPAQLFRLFSSRCISTHLPTARTSTLEFGTILWKFVF